MFSVGDICTDPNRIPVLRSSFAVLTGIAVVDWWTEPYFSLGFFYLFPIAFGGRARLRVRMTARGFQFPGLVERVHSAGFEALALPGVRLLIADLVHKRG
jgi:hypothetical protein